ncbi:hypothetical protein GBAR_LOCUS17134 [Geodia barretti]|uniref:Uncharacterized protein n=1 Tax=Geodia barretti TaxID=519541 RepID=A0AA35SK59_GEOBA|nr:hypothetical protein GBAR_LOCUS17134 [Geodia barretti]
MEKSKESEMVTELREQVRQRNTELEAVHGDIRSIRDTIRKESQERKKFMSSVIRVDEAAELVTDHEQLRESLQVRQAQLRNLHTGSAQEQRELERVKEQVEELQKCQLKVSGQREQDTLAVEGLTII